MLSLPFAALLLASPQALAGSPGEAVRRDAVHLHLQSDLLAQSGLRAEESGWSRQTTAVGPGAGRTTLEGAWHLRARSAIGGRVSLSQQRVDLDSGSVRQGAAQLAATYTHHFPLPGPLRATATGLLGASRWTDEATGLRASAPFLGAAGGVQWFAVPRASLGVGLEATRSFGGRLEQDGVEGSSRLAAFDVAAVGGVHLYLGGRDKARRPRARRGANPRRGARR